MDNLELIKENVQPLKSGRKIDSLTAALNSDPNETRRREETKLEFENKLTNSSDEELVDVYYNYIHWIEQNYPQGGKDTNLKSIFEKCIQKFYNDDQFKNNEKLLTIFLKYTNTLNDPLELFNFFYKAGFAKRLAKFYITWSFYFETQNNFKKAIKVIEAGIHNKAEPIAELNKTLNDLQVRTMRHVISNPEESETTSRKALNSLKVKVDGHGKVEAPVKRSGNAILKIQSGGLRNPMEKSSKSQVEKLNILCDENVEPTATPVSDFVSAASSNRLPISNQENERSPGKWPENKLKTKGLRVKPVSSSFEILEDNNDKTDKAEPVKDVKPIIPKANDPDIPVAKFEDKSQMKRYVWYNKMEEIYRDNTEYSFEEIRHKKWLETMNNVKQEESNSVSKSLCDSSDINETYKCGATSIVRGFYNGTFTANTTVLNDQLHSQYDLKNTVANKSDENIPSQENKFQIFSETTAITEKLNCTEVAFKSPESNQAKPTDFTISTFKDDEFNSCLASSTPSVNRAFKTPQNNSTMKYFNHPNFVNGITAKILSPIIETSRDCHSKSSSSSGSTAITTGSTMSSTTANSHTSRKLFSFPDNINPFEKDLKAHLLQTLAETVEFRKGFSAIKQMLPCINVNGETFNIGNSTYFAKLLIMDDNNSTKVFQIDFYQPDKDSETFETFLLKICNDLNYWDFYIRDELQRRIFTQQNNGLITTLSQMPMRETVFYNNGYISLYNQLSFATLQQAIDHFRKINQPFPEILIKHFIFELMHIIQKFHQCNIIQADVNPENILLFNINFEANSFEKEMQTFRFLDFSKSIDMRLLPEGTVFSKNYTDNGSYTILDSKNWSYSVDWIGFLNCIHQMYFGTELNVHYENSKWRHENSFKNSENQYLNDIFDMLLNLEPQQKPDLKVFSDRIILDLKRDFTELHDAFLDLKFTFYENLIYL